MAIPVLGLVALTQSTVVARWSMLGVSPDLMLMVVVTWVLVQGLREGAFAALVGGLVLDGLSGAPLGVGTAALLVAAVLVSVGELNVFRTARLLPLIAIVAATLAHGLVVMLLLQISGWVMPWEATTLRVLAPSVLVNLVCMPPVYLLGRWLKRRFGAPSVEWE